MNVTTPDGRVIGRVDLTPTDVAALAHGVGADVERRARALIGAQRAAIATGGGWTPGPRPVDGERGEDRPRRRRWWPWLAGVFAGLAMFGMIADGNDDAAPTSAPGVPVGAPTVAPVPADAARAVPADDGSILVGSVVIDNVFDDGSPLRERFASVIAAYGATGTVGTELDANLRDGVAFCRGLARGEPLPHRHAAIVTGEPGAGYGDLGTQRRAIVTASLSTLCPAL
ncbi:hypothetical protein QLT00_gp87 [Gordonia phage Commandaria]|uniref:DUF732 domain-containing protein n=1 Tax=Gordonia phage Commandaria TaxID=3038364 RepID=A0AAF0GGV1_9CAUD|nr:hypothetical protein QLT00_gp87 [Gordonia phage Commandaria]WGH20870.1 hypothetical protein [Gordonia phage Commandaria]